MVSKLGVKDKERIWLSHREDFFFWQVSLPSFPFGIMHACMHVVDLARLVQGFFGGVLLIEEFMIL